MSNCGRKSVVIDLVFDAADNIDNHYDGTVIIGSDCLAIGANDIEIVFQELKKHDLVITLLI
ncbi:MAG: DUF2064 domain-containing protein [Candidatus Omnitrophica bacterium]|nr:DUF2064 domain-containing protein [Candidatus Omnitrophota bacterium]